MASGSSPAPDLPDISDVAQWDHSSAVIDGGFGSGWMPRDDSQFTSSSADRQQLCQTQEPEAEDEADGWDIVLPAQSNRSRTSSFNDTFPEKLSCRPDEVPDDLLMGCLDPECDSLFGPGCERQRCASCRLAFCSKHLHGPWFHSAFARASPGGDGLGSIGNLPESLGLPFGGHQVFLCRECHQALPLTSAPSELLPPCAGSCDDRGTCSALSPGDMPQLAAEAQVLQSCSYPVLCKAEEESSSRASARALLLRLLGQLKVCLRSWTESEREWILGMAEDLVETDPRWIAQLARHANWETQQEAKLIAQLVERAHNRKKLDGREAIEILGLLGRKAGLAASALGERHLGLVATHLAEALTLFVGPAELACCLELLLDAAHELGAAGATGGRRAVVGALSKVAKGDCSGAKSLRGELFWALEARVKEAAVARRSVVISSTNGNPSSSPAIDAWASIALQELLRGCSAEDELGLLRQRAWVRHMEQREVECCRVEPAWGESRGFPLAVWPPDRRCLGLEGWPRETESKSAPIIMRCRFRDDAASNPARSDDGGTGSNACNGGSVSSSAGRQSGKQRGDTRRSTAGLLLKQDVGMHREQQVGQTLRLLEVLIWEDEALQALLVQQGLTLEDVRATYIIAMTGPGTAMLEFVEGARTLRDVRSGRYVTPAALGTRLLLSPGERGTLLTFVRQHSSAQDLPKALARLAFTSAVSAVLSFVAGLGDRHHENFMVTIDGRLVHVDYGYALGREPLDSMLIHYAVHGQRPATTLQYEELQEALGADRLDRIFWPVVRNAYLRVRQHPGLLAEMFQAALVREPRRDLQRLGANNSAAMQRAWSEAQAFVARNCVTAMSEQCAARFIRSLLVHCTQHERSTHLRDELKGLRLKENTRQAVSKAFQAAVSTGRSATNTTRVAAGLAADVVSAGPTLHDVTTAAKGMALGLLGGVKELFLETALLDEGTGNSR